MEVTTAGAVEAEELPNESSGDCDAVFVDEFADEALLVSVGLSFLQATNDRAHAAIKIRDVLVYGCT